MHMADALVSAPVALSAGAVALGLVIVACKKVSEIKRSDIVPLMGVLGAFVFAAQMINFTIPGTGSSGHIIGGVLLSAILGPWAAFITLCAVLIDQCLIFADGGLLALGCNVINMAAVSCLLAYPLVFRPIAGKSPSVVSVSVASVAASVVGLLCGALLVTAETELSGITALPIGQFLMFMLPIHLLIGIGEGLATAAVLVYVLKVRPALFYDPDRISGNESGKLSKSTKRVLWTFAAIAVIFALGFTWIASSNPDGLEWSIMRITGDTELAPPSDPPTAFLPGYESALSGIIGGVIMLCLIWVFSVLIFRKRRSAKVS